MEIVIIIVLLILGSIFFTTILNIFFWQKIQNSSSEIPDTVSVLIPARNESENIIPCLKLIVHQRNVNEVLIYNDHSDDDTAELVKEFSKTHTLVRLLDPLDLPEGWTGKNFACYQLALNAKSDWLLFIDADTRLSPQAISGILEQAKKWKATFVSCWPGLEMLTFWEKLLMPLLNFFVYIIYPAPISFQYDMPSLGIAHGACIMIKRETYNKIGGHVKVQNKIFEDTELARLWRKEGERSLCFDGQEVVRVRMYKSFMDIWIGFQKNFYPGFNSSFSFWLFLLFHTVLFLLPFFFLLSSSYFLIMAISVWLIRILLAVRFKHPIWSAILHPIGEIFLIMLGIASWWHFEKGKGVQWKGRVYLKERK